MQRIAKSPSLDTICVTVASRSLRTHSKPSDNLCKAQSSGMSHIGWYDQRLAHTGFWTGSAFSCCVGRCCRLIFLFFLLWHMLRLCWRWHHTPHLLRHHPLHMLNNSLTLAAAWHWQNSWHRGDDWHLQNVANNKTIDADKLLQRMNLHFASTTCPHMQGKRIARHTYHMFLATSEILTTALLQLCCNWLPPCSLNHVTHVGSYAANIPQLAPTLLCDTCYGSQAAQIPEKKANRTASNHAVCVEFILRVLVHCSTPRRHMKWVGLNSSRSNKTPNLKMPMSKAVKHQKGHIDVLQTNCTPSGISINSANIGSWLSAKQHMYTSVSQGLGLTCNDVGMASHIHTWTHSHFTSHSHHPRVQHWALWSKNATKTDIGHRCVTACASERDQEYHLLKHGCSKPSLTSTAAGFQRAQSPKNRPIQPAGFIGQSMISCQWTLPLACRHDKDIWSKNFCWHAMGHLFRTVFSTFWNPTALSGWNAPKLSRHMLKHHINSKKKANNAFSWICKYVFILHYVLAWKKESHYTLTVTHKTEMQDAWHMWGHS